MFQPASERELKVCEAVLYTDSSYGLFLWQMEQPKDIDPQVLIDKYGLDARVAFGNDMSMELGQALEAERMFCPAGDAARQDPRRRVGYLANILAAGGSLRPEDEQYLAPTE